MRALKACAYKSSYNRRGLGWLRWTYELGRPSTNSRRYNPSAEPRSSGISSIEARARGIYVEPGQFEVPLVAYHPADLGSRMTWAQLGIPNCARKGGVPDGLSITILPGSRRLTAEGGKVRPWTVDSVARISEMAEMYLSQGGE